MPHLLQPAAGDALAAVLRRSPLLAFDFDGTLTPIVATPDQARISQAVSGKLQRLARRLPVAIVTGRRVDDVRPRLGFQPHFVIGNHGAEMDEADVAHGAGALQEVRGELERREVELARAGIMVEDKGLSLALHYRLSRRPDEALALIREVLRQHGAAVRPEGQDRRLRSGPRRLKRRRYGARSVAWLIAMACTTAATSVASCRCGLTSRTISRAQSSCSRASAAAVSRLFCQAGFRSGRWASMDASV
ncbi:MAG: trehalose-phosphatase [Ramlibacter sp.]